MANMTREEVAAIVEVRMFGAAKPALHTHIECNCPGLTHRVGKYATGYWEGCYCPECASKEAVKHGLGADETTAEHEGPDDTPQWCENCGRLITLRTTTVVPWGITPSGALEELEYFENNFGAGHKKPSTPDEWQEFLLLVDSIDEAHIHRVDALVWARNSPASAERLATIIGAELTRRNIAVVIGPSGDCSLIPDDTVLRWDAANATISVNIGTMFDRVLTLAMAERILAKLATSPVEVRRTRYWLLDLFDNECVATTGHHLGLRKHSFHPWKETHHEP